jgi:multidrug efflux pump subunit AcrA (membrane-fusion protein)
MTVRAPTDGRVHQLVADPGTTLTGGMGKAESFDGSTVVTLYRPDSLQVRVDVRFEDIPKVALGQPVEIDNPALTEPIWGTVLFVSSEADIQKNTLEVKVGIPSPPKVFKPAMLVDVTFLAPPQDDAKTPPSDEMRIYVPEGLVHRDEAGTFVWVADQAASVARRVPVDTGAMAGNELIEIKSGLVISSRIIATGDENLADGDRIEVAGEATNPVSAGSTSGSRRTMSRLPPAENH